MKKLAILLAIVMITTSVQSQEIKKVKINDLLKIIDTSSTPLVINFWASWCAPCIKEIPWFEKSIATFKDQNVQLILVSLDFEEDYPKGIAAFAKKNNYQSKIVWLDETNADEFCPKIDEKWDGAIPVTLMVNKKRQYRQFYAQQLPEQRLILELQKLVGK